MKPHRILKTFKGTQTGHGDGETFNEGDILPLSAHLAAVVVPAGLAEPHDPEIQPRELAEGEVLEAAELPEGSQAVEEKSETEAPSNKAKKAAPSNKSKKSA